MKQENTNVTANVLASLEQLSLKDSKEIFHCPSIEQQAADLGIDTEGLTKNALKKTVRDKLREITREEWKAKKRLKLKAKKKEKLELIQTGLLPPPEKKLLIEQEPSNVKIVLDLGFDSLMSDKEVASMHGQIRRCYSANKICKHPVNLILTSLSGKLQTRFEHITDWKSWKNIQVETQDYLDMYPKEKLVYLTADSPHIIQDLDESKVYLIGGIVDKNRYKYLTYEKAQQQGIQTAQLPIGDFVKLASRKVLAVNHVFEILVEFLECKDWEQAFMKVIPKRKFADQESHPNSILEEDA
ncbi:tRNA (guanine(9)-N(1))-methyltransferase [Basidiobolus ranarum]|uniref:tRNA (guanine(9)-N1)-methyltransferase n=1 Tax=Basidiobolus ranarum TaxID=34480 RepID=A0ABR2WJX2_9FUNG